MIGPYIHKSFYIIYREGQLEDPSPSNGSVGKLKLTSEMKEKLEGALGGGSRKNSVKSTASKKSEGSMETSGDPVGKLEEKKKLLMEQKLGAGKTTFQLSLHHRDCKLMRIL